MKMRMSQIICLNLCCSIIALMFSCAHTIEDNFENERKAFWHSGARSGDSSPWAKTETIEDRPAYCFTVKKGDHHTSTDIKNQQTERSEIYLDVSQHGDLPQQTVWYAYDIFIPKDFPTTSNRLVMGQWFSKAPHSPSISNRFQSDQFSVKIKAKNSDKKFKFKGFKRQTWNKLVYKIIFSTRKGELQVWLNNTQVVDYKGPTAIVDHPHFFKMGLYRDIFDQDMTACFAHFKRSNKSLLKD